MGRPAVLESFDDDHPGLLDADPALDEARQAGYVQGLADARSQSLADTERLNQDLLQTLQDMTFGYTEARDAILKDLQPLFEALCQGFIPALAEASMVPQITQALMGLAEESASTPLRLSLAPDQVASVSEALASQPQLPFQAVPAPELAPHQALISGGAESVIVDLDGLIALATTCLTTLGPQPERTASHG